MLVEQQNKIQVRSRTGTLPPVLALGSGLTAVGVIRSLGRAGIPCYSICRPGEPARKSRWYCPAPGTSDYYPSPEELGSYLKSGSIREAILIATSDDWVRAIAALPEEMQERFPSSNPTLETAELMTDKWRFAQFLEGLDIPRPKTLLLHSLAEMSALPEPCYANMFLKPIDSQLFAMHHSVKAFRVESKQQALDIMSRTEAGGRSAFPILLQEYIPGPTTNYYLVDGFADRHSRIRALIARRRIRMYPPVFGNSTVSETIAVHSVQPAANALERVLASVGYRGIFDAEFKYDSRDGQYKLIEINARPWWFVEFATRCGIDLCRMAYRDALDLPIESPPSYPIGRRCNYLLKDFAGTYATGKGLRRYWDWALSLRRTEDILYRWDDPGPGIYATVSTIKKILQRNTAEN